METKEMTPEQAEQNIRLLVEEDDVVPCKLEWLNLRITELSRIANRARKTVKKRSLRQSRAKINL